jgi:hypothetical protein
LQWLSEGLRDKDIGPLLGVTTRSVTRIVREICEKLDARTRTQAVSIFLREQMTKIMWDIESVAVARSPSALFPLPAQRLLRDSNSQ